MLLPMKGQLDHRSPSPGSYMIQLLFNFKMESKYLFCLYLIIQSTLYFEHTIGFGTGPPVALFPVVCQTMNPFGHGPSIIPRFVPPPYEINLEPASYRPGESLKGKNLVQSTVPYLDPGTEY